jgi:hypothetical protein
MAAPGVPDFLTVDEAARILRIGRTAAYELARRWPATDGREGLPVRKVGKQLRVPLTLFEQHYGICVTAIPARDRPARRAAVNSSAPVRNLDSAPSKPAGRRRANRGGAQNGLPFAG